MASIKRFCSFLLIGSFRLYFSDAQSTCCFDQAHCGVCVDQTSASACVGPSYSAAPPGQLNCAAPLFCCYPNAGTPFTNPPFGYTTTPLPPWATTPYNPYNPYVTTPYNPYNPYGTTPYNPYNPYVTTPYNPYNPYGTTPYNPNNPYVTTPYNPYNPYVTTTPYPGQSGICSGRIGPRMEVSGNSVAMLSEASAQDFVSREDKNGNETSHSRVKRVVGGYTVPDGNLCYQVAIMDGRTNVLVATGALIWDNFVLSSFSSLNRADPTGTNFRVLPGGRSIAQFTATGSVNVGFRVLQVIQNPSYVARYPGFNFPANDAALLRLESSMDPSATCKLCMPPFPLPEFRQTYTAGYGSASELSQSTDGLIRRVNVAVIPRPVCDIVYRTVFPSAQNFRLDPNAMCAGGELGKDTCNKDGGAPLVGEDVQNNRFLLGLSTWGIGCGRYGYPSVYTNATSLLQWIQTVTPVLTVNGQVGGANG